MHHLKDNSGNGENEGSDLISPSKQCSWRKFSGYHTCKSSCHKILFRPGEIPWQNLKVATMNQYYADSRSPSWGNVALQTPELCSDRI